MRIRNKNENIEFVNNIKSAIEDVEQAIDGVTYISYPEMNKRTRENLRKAIAIMEDTLNMCIFKP